MQVKQMNYKQAVEFLNNSNDFEIWKAVVEKRFPDKVVNKIEKNASKEIWAYTSLRRGAQYLKATINEANYLTDCLSISDSPFNINTTKKEYAKHSITDYEQKMQSLLATKTRTMEKVVEDVDQIFVSGRLLDNMLAKLDKISEYFIENKDLDKAYEVNKLEQELKVEADKLFARTDWDKIAKEDGLIAGNIPNMLDKYYLNNHAKDLLLTNNGTELRFSGLVTDLIVSDLKESNPEAYLSFYNTVKENNVTHDKTGTPYADNFRKTRSGDVAFRSTQGTFGNSDPTGGMSEGM